MSHSNSSPTRAQAARRRKQALDLRCAGASFSEIGRAMGYSEARAHRVVTLELDRLNTRRAESAEAVLRLEEARLDRYLERLQPRINTGDPQAIAQAVAIGARRARLRGLDAPTKAQVSGPNGVPLQVSLEVVIAELDAWERKQSGLEEKRTAGLESGENPAIAQGALPQDGETV